MKTVIENTGITPNDPNLQIPIKLEDVQIYKNQLGQWCVYFASKNHKYLRVEYNVSTSIVNGEIIPSEIGMAHGITLETFEEYNDGVSKFDWPCDSLMIWFVPETKEESKELIGVAAILPTKWAYQICIVKYEDFNPKDDE